MTDSTSNTDSMSLVSRISPSDTSSVLATYCSQQRLMEIKETANREVISAQKRSVEAALVEAQINADRVLKCARLEKHSLVSEKVDLEIRLKNLERRLNEANELNEALIKNLQETKLDSQSRFATIIETYKLEEGKAEKIDELNAQLVELKSQFESKTTEIRDLNVEIQTLRGQLNISELKCSNLQRSRMDAEANLLELASLKDKINDLVSENSNLRDQIERVTHAPGNASSLLSRPDGSGLCLRSSSLLQTTRLEQRVIRLETENAELRRSEVQLAIARAQLDDLKSRLERATEWRERALESEEKLASLNTVSSPEGSEGRRNALAQCQRENALLLSELGQIRSELLSTTAELKNVDSRYSTLIEEESKMKTKLDCLEARCRLLTRRVKVLQQERDLYKHFVDSYEDADATLSSPGGELVHQFKHMVEGVAESLGTFHREAEADNAEIERLIGEVAYVVGSARADSDAGVSADLAISSSDRRTIQQLREAVCELEDCLERTKQAKQAAEDEVECLRACGAYNPDETKVLHFLANPADEAKRNREEELINLRKENAQLQQRVNILQDRLTRFYESRSSEGYEPDATSGNVTMAVKETLKNHPDPISEIQKLRSQLQAERWRGDRLMETFASASSEFREACALLFGYNLHIRQSGIYKVQMRPSSTFSISSSSSSADAVTSYPFIKFKRSGDGLVLMETTLKDEEASYFLNSRLPIPLTLARLLLLANGVHDINAREESTMLM